MRSILIIAVLIALGHALPNYDDVHQEWKAFKAEHKKFYHNVVEDLQRLKIYLENKEKILKHNQLFKKGLATFYMAENKFADMFPHEYASSMPPLNLTEVNMEAMPYISPRISSRPASMDWRLGGAVFYVKQQGKCNSSWAFSAVGAMEARHYRDTGKLIPLSEQNLIDCTRSYGNKGCDGGWPHNAFRYVIDKHGIDYELNYRYEGVEKECRFDRNYIGATIGRYVRIEESNEDALADALANEGPISVVIDSGHDSITFYKGGVINEPQCNPNNLDLAVLLVGYGTDPEFGDYWLLKNSWGTLYGDEGYLRLARNKKNMCGIATLATYPLFGIH